MQSVRKALGMEVVVIQSAVVEGIPTASGVTAARGFRASGVHCGIRRRRPDLAMIVSDGPASGAAVFTRNAVKAAPVVYCRDALAESGGRVRAVVVNSGNANACTGPEGMAHTRLTASAVAEILGVATHEILVSSTGVIGQRLPIEKLLAGLPLAASSLSSDGGFMASEAILTTDTRSKLSVRTVETSAGRYTVGGMAKGSGMVHPDMATTLGFVTTDAVVPPLLLHRALTQAVDRSFNRITVDGDTSTNDMVVVMANGASGVRVDFHDDQGFGAALEEVLTDLAKEVARDGEGASKLIEVRVVGGRSDADALAVARTVSGSPLVKTAVHGADANWGRIVAAAGRSGVAVADDRMRVRICGIDVLRPGFVSDFSEDEATARMRGDEVVIEVDLGCGDGEAVCWSCDLTAGYVQINAAYRT
jgi:glutamate N-acetyltransferase/amino-acid N-acetyltransferase